MKNESIVLSKRPASTDVIDCFSRAQCAVPEPQDGEMLLQTLWLSVEPYMMLAIGGSHNLRMRRVEHRGQMLGAKYATGVELGEPMCGATISRVLASRHRDFAEGDLVSTYSGWQAYAIDDGSVARKISGALPLAAYLGVLGIPGMTGYVGMKNFGLPKAGETVVISAAFGAVGTVAGAVAKKQGARTVGIVGGPEKCRALVEQLGFDAAVDRRAADFPQRLAEACPRGIDIYFENVGGMVWQAVFPLLRFFARVPVCGLVSGYGPNAAVASYDHVPEVMKKIMLYRMSLRGFAVFDHIDQEEEFLTQVEGWIKSGEISYIDEVYQGLGQAPQALSDLLGGRTAGKVVVHVAD